MLKKCSPRRSSSNGSHLLKERRRLVVHRLGHFMVIRAVHLLCDSKRPLVELVRLVVLALLICDGYRIFDNERRQHSSLKA